MQKILIVDDVDKIREIYKYLLLDEGYEVFEAPNVYKAIHIISEESIDVIILDIYMPGINGAKLFDVIQKSDRTFKIIIASVFSLDEQRKRIIGATDYYDKSQGTEILLKKIKAALDGRKGVRLYDKNYAC